MKNLGKLRRNISVALLAIVFSMLLAACGASATNTPAPAAATTAPASAATTAPASAATTAPAATTAAARPTTAAGATPAATTAAASAPVPTVTPVPPIPQPAGSIKLTFWYGLSGQLGNVVQQTVNKYNQSQNKYYVEAIFQASYDDTINKVNTSLAGGNLPNILQIFDAGTQRMIDTGRVVAVQDLVEKDKEKDKLQTWIEDLEPAVRSYFTVNGKLWSMPFNNSTAMVYYDKKAFREAGLDPEKKIWTYNELVEAGKKLTKKDASGKVTRTGIAFQPASWFFEQQLAVHNELLVDPQNGRQGRGTKYAFNNETGIKWLEFLKKVQDEGAGTNYGSVSPQNAFVKGEAAIHFDSIASLRGIVGSVESAKSGVEVGVAYMPRRDGAPAYGRTIIGGASLWITDQGSKEQQEGAWDFVKWSIQADTQAFWSSNTGYYPVRRASYELPEMKEALAKYPQFQVAIDQIRSAPANPFNAGGISGTFVSMRQDIQAAMDNFWSGKTPNAKAALDEAVKKANDKLEEYNSTVKK